MLYVCTHTHTHRRRKMTLTHTHTHTHTHMYQRKVPKREKKTMLHANRGNEASTEVIIPLITGDPISLNVASTRSSRVPGWCAYADTDSEGVSALIHNPHAASGWRIHCGVEVTELSTNKQHTFYLVLHTILSGVHMYYILSKAVCIC